jgi:hypothetical protein
MNWTSAIQHKPSDLEEVLIFDDTQGFRVGYYSLGTDTFFGIADGAKLSHATYWMPLPEIPVSN